ncbi:hypothetical protein ATZ36_10135 [Candidatus Endomicrobiellum trichonymphae]|uniref:Uncharacterized protein n=1 Tax=Endomicrobium trichonymphae TaxID=1408204 RepID=A0A1E5IFW8_ENDTX|nr:hypothetical protein ATZ36_10135 [Candidatus Endomicrobium trichonymphae]
MKNTEKYLKKERTKSFNAVFNRFLGKPKLSAEIALVKREAAISGDENILSVIAKDCKEKKPVPKFINLLTASTLRTFNFLK